MQNAMQCLIRRLHQAKLCNIWSDVVFNVYWHFNVWIFLLVNVFSLKLCKAIELTCSVESMQSCPLILRSLSDVRTRVWCEYYVTLVCDENIHCENIVNCTEVDLESNAVAGERTKTWTPGMIGTQRPPLSTTANGNELR